MSAPSDALKAEFAKLYASKIVATMQDRTATAPETTNLQGVLDRLQILQQEYVEKQVQQNLLGKLVHVQSLEDLKDAAASKDHVDADYEKNKQGLEAAVQARLEVLRRIEATTLKIEQEKKNVIEYEKGRPAFENEVEKLTRTWKELQKKNAQRKAAIQMSTNLMINDEEDCSRVLDQQTQSIQDLHTTQKLLEDKKIDISTQVAQTKKKITALAKLNDLRRKDVEIKQREQEYLTLQHMKHWYEEMSQVLRTMSGLEITQMTDEFMEVCVLKTHSLRLFYDPTSMRLSHVEFLDDNAPAKHLAEIAVRDNDPQFLLCEYRDRIRNKSAV